MSDHDYTSSTTVTTCYVEQRQFEPVFADLSSAHLDLDYLKTLSGMVKCIAIVLNFICFICLLAGGPAYFSGAGWATFVTTVGLGVSLTLLCLYLFRIVDIVTRIPWIICEMIFCFAWTIFFFITASVLAVASVKYRTGAGYAAAAFFAFGAMCTYAFDCYLKFLAWKANEIATGGTPMTTTYSTGPSVQKKVVISEPYKQ